MVLRLARPPGLWTLGATDHVLVAAERSSSAAASLSRRTSGSTRSLALIRSGSMVRRGSDSPRTRAGRVRACPSGAAPAAAISRARSGSDSPNISSPPSELDAVGPRAKRGFFTSAGAAGPSRTGKRRGSCCLGRPMRVTFDRGTLLFAHEGQEVDLANIPWILWDARVGSYRALPYRHAAILANLRAR